eukprot:1045500-Prymnesium_polylepis.1
MRAALVHGPTSLEGLQLHHLGPRRALVHGHPAVRKVVVCALVAKIVARPLVGFVRILLRRVHHHRHACKVIDGSRRVTFVRVRVPLGRDEVHHLALCRALIHGHLAGCKVVVRDGVVADVPQVLHLVGDARVTRRGKQAFTAGVVRERRKVLEMRRLCIRAYRRDVALVVIPEPARHPARGQQIHGFTACHVLLHHHPRTCTEVVVRGVGVASTVPFVGDIRLWLRDVHSHPRACTEVIDIPSGSRRIPLVLAPRPGSRHQFHHLPLGRVLIHRHLAARKVVVRGHLRLVCRVPQVLQLRDGSRRGEEIRATDALLDGRDALQVVLLRVRFDERNMPDALGPRPSRAVQLHSDPHEVVLLDRRDVLPPVKAEVALRRACAHGHAHARKVIHKRVVGGLHVPAAMDGPGVVVDNVHGRAQEMIRLIGPRVAVVP